MRNCIATLLFLLSLYIASTPAASQPPRPGDLAILQITASDDDYVAMILLRGPADLRGLGYTDNGWLADGGFRGGEGRATLPNHPAWSQVTAGTIIEIGANLPPDNDPSDGFLAAPFPETLSPRLATAGDQFFVFAGEFAHPVLICGVHTSGSAWDTDSTNSQSSAMPDVPGNFLAVGREETRRWANAYFGPTEAIRGTVETVLKIIMDRENWKGINTRPENRSFAQIIIINDEEEPGEPNQAHYWNSYQ